MKVIIFLPRKQYLEMKNTTFKNPLLIVNGYYFY